MLVFFVCSLLIFVSQAGAATPVEPLVSVQWLKKNLNRVRLLDVRNDPEMFFAPPTTPPTKNGFWGHIPGAILAPWPYLTENQWLDDHKVRFMTLTQTDFNRLRTYSGCWKPAYRHHDTKFWLSHSVSYRGLYP